MIALVGPSLAHVASALALQWLSALPFMFFLAPDFYVPAITGALWGGFYFGREFEQMWPHAGYKPRPDIEQQDVERFMRQGLYPLLFNVLTAAAYISYRGVA